MLSIRIVGVLIIRVLFAFYVIFVLGVVLDQMILENGITNDPERVGFYSGLIESIFAFTSFLSSQFSLYLSRHTHT